MEYQYNIAGHLCRIVFCDAGNDSSLLPSFSPFKSEEEGNLLFCLSVDDAFRWPVTGEEVGQFDCGGNNFGVYRLPDGSYQFEICDEKKALCCYLQANADFSDCTAALVARLIQKKRAKLIAATKRVTRPLQFRSSSIFCRRQRAKNRNTKLFNPITPNKY